MPIYEYHCENCNNEFELMESVGSSTEKKCEKCGGTAHRKISASAFHLKGGGWYATGSKKTPAKACESAKSDSPACQGCAHAAENV